MAANAQQQDAVALLKADHRKVEELFKKYESVGSSDEKRELVRQICNELIVHSTLEEEIFYPACREKSVEDDLLDEAQVEHDSAKVLIADLMREQPDAPFYDAKVAVLSEYIKHHVGEEEKSSTGIFAKAQAAKVDMSALGQRLQARKQQVTASVAADGGSPPQPRALEVRLSPANGDDLQENDVMERYRDRNRERDEYGRFTSDEDDYRSSGRGRSRAGSRERDEYGRFTSDDDDYRSSGRGQSRGGGGEQDEYGRFTSDDDYYRGSSRGQSRGGYRERDEYGRFMIDEDKYRGSGRGQSRTGGPERDEYGRFTSDDDERGGDSRRMREDRRYDDDDDGRGRGQGGWFGDSRGHAEAARRGWEDRGSSRSMRSRDDDDDRSRGRGRDQGGWFGDSEGHAEAARRGWEERRHSRSSSRGREDDDRRRRSSGRDDDDGRGWFGDSRGHAEAARRGWQNR